MSNRENKNCSELLLTNGMGLDRAPVEFQKLRFLRPPNMYIAEIRRTLLNLAEIYACVRFVINPISLGGGINTLKRAEKVETGLMLLNAGGEEYGAK